MGGRGGINPGPATVEEVGRTMAELTHLNKDPPSQGSFTAEHPHSSTFSTLSRF